MEFEKANVDGTIEVQDQSGEQFAAVWNWLLNRQDLSTSEKMVWISLKSYAGYQEIRPSVQKVATRASVSIRTAQRSINVLCEKELIRVERRSRPDGGFATNRYILLSAARNKAGRRVGDTMTPTPADKAAPTPGDILSAPHPPQCHHKEYIKKIKNKTTTDVVVSNEIKKIVACSPFQKLDEKSLTALLKKYGITLVFDTLDMLIQTYQQNAKQINDPTAILASGLSKGVVPPVGYVPYAERVKSEQKTKELSEQKHLADVNKEKAEKDAYAKKAAVFDALNQADKEIWLDRAKSELSPAVRNSKLAVRSMAVELYNKREHSDFISEL